MLNNTEWAKYIVDRSEYEKAKKLRREGKISAKEYHRIYMRYKATKDAMKRQISRPRMRV